MDFIFEPWPWFVGGPLIALSLVLYFYFGKNFGTSTDFETLCTLAGAGKFSDYFKKDWKERYFNFPKWRTLYQTLAFYPDSPETHEAFKKTISTRNKKKREYLSKYLDIALIKSPNPKFEVYKNSLNYNRNDYLFDLELNAE